MFLQASSGYHKHCTRNLAQHGEEYNYGSPTTIFNYIPVHATCMYKPTTGIMSKTSVYLKEVQTLKLQVPGKNTKNPAAFTQNLASSHSIYIIAFSKDACKQSTLALAKTTNHSLGSSSVKNPSNKYQQYLQCWVGLCSELDDYQVYLTVTN